MRSAASASSVTKRTRTRDVGSGSCAWPSRVCAARGASATSVARARIGVIGGTLRGSRVLECGVQLARGRLVPRIQTQDRPELLDRFLARAGLEQRAAERRECEKVPGLETHRLPVVRQSL